MRLISSLILTTSFVATSVFAQSAATPGQMVPIPQPNHASPKLIEKITPSNQPNIVPSRVTEQEVQPTKTSNLPLPQIQPSLPTQESVNKKINN
jgi:hypothetical protein